MASDSAEDEAAYLAQRMREGQLEPARLAFAAWLGYPAALALVVFFSVHAFGVAQEHMDSIISALLPFST